MAAYLIYSFFLTGFIQPVTVHWTWSNGFLLYPPESLRLPPDVYFRDYAGGSNVHAVGGIAALIACIFIGPRIGRFDATTHKKYHIPGLFGNIKLKKKSNSNFGQNIDIFCEKSKFLLKAEILVKSRILVKTNILVKKSKFLSKTNILVKK